MIYLNNAATSYPKPDTVVEAVKKSLQSPPETPYRENVTNTSQIELCRISLAELFNYSHPERVIFTSGATEAINIAINGTIRDKCHVVTTGLEHNAVLRPLYHLEGMGRIRFDVVPVSAVGAVCIEQLRSVLHRDTCLCIVNHASNVTGFIQNIRLIYRICREVSVPLLIDASQSAGIVELDFSNMPYAMIAFTGHKGLLGPSGIGGLIVGEKVDLQIWKLGGNGIHSHLNTMPDLWPLKFEPGTMNQVGIAGLQAGIRYVLNYGTCSISQKKCELVANLYQQLKKIDGITLYSEEPDSNRTGVVGFVLENYRLNEVGYVLGESFDIKVRVGLHCAPLIHKAMGTYPNGTVRVSFSHFNTHEEVDALVAAIKLIKTMI